MNVHKNGEITRENLIQSNETSFEEITDHCSKKDSVIAEIVLSISSLRCLSENMIEIE